MKKNKDPRPLRTFRYWNGESSIVLECGHTKYRSKDQMDPTTRIRCTKCISGAIPEVSQAQIAATMESIQLMKLPLPGAHEIVTILNGPAAGLPDVIQQARVFSQMGFNLSVVTVGRALALGLIKHSDPADNFSTLVAVNPDHVPSGPLRCHACDAHIDPALWYERLVPKTLLAEGTPFLAICEECKAKARYPDAR